MDEHRPVRWPGVVGTLASVLGLCISAYLTYEHYTGSATLACSDRGTVNCLAVTTSAYSKVAGVPVAVLGLLFFVVMLVFQLPAMWGRSDHGIPKARVAWALLGVAAVVYLVGTELFLIDAICIWCTAVHVLTLIVFGSTVWATLGTGHRDPEGFDGSFP